MGGVTGISAPALPDCPNLLGRLILNPKPVQPAAEAPQNLRLGFDPCNVLPRGKVLNGTAWRPAISLFAEECSPKVDSGDAHVTGKGHDLRIGRMTLPAWPWPIRSG
jgi:hypothetical protein